MTKISRAPDYTNIMFKWKWKWRLSRKEFLWQSLWFSIASFISLAMIWNSEPWDMWWIIWTMFWVTFIPMLLVTHIKRFHDLGYSWFWVIFEFTIILNLIIWPFLYFLKWNYWPNLYWYDPLIDYEKQKKYVEVKDSVLYVKKMEININNNSVSNKKTDTNIKIKDNNSVKSNTKNTIKNKHTKNNIEVQNENDDWDF